MALLKNLLILMLAFALAGCDDDDESAAASNPDLPGSLAGSVVEMEFSFAATGAPFSQGTLMTLHMGLRRKVAPAALLGYAGGLVGRERLAEQCSASSRCDDRRSPMARR